MLVVVEEFTLCVYLVLRQVRSLSLQFSIGGFHVMSSPPCWWTKTIDLSLAPFVRPPAFVRFTIVICVSRDWLKTTYIFRFFGVIEKLSLVTVNHWKRKFLTRLLMMKTARSSQHVMTCCATCISGTCTLKREREGCQANWELIF